MKTIRCPECGQEYESNLPRCPLCQSQNPNPEQRNDKRFLDPLGFGWKRQLVFLLVGLAGFQILGLVISFVAELAQVNALRAQGISDSNELREALQAYVASAQFNGLVNFLAYGLIFTAVALVIWKNWVQIAKVFKNPKTYLGFAFGVAIVAWNILYSMLVDKLGFSTNNGNQETVESIVSAYPVLCIFFLGIIGPFVEEMTYRVGLFGLCKRWHVAFAYVIVPLIFGFIHFDWQNITSAVEWINLPNYVISGLLLCVAYERFGLGASLIAHIGNNMLGIILQLIPSK